MSPPLDPSGKNYSGNVRKALVSGFFMQIGHLQKRGDYLTVKDNQVKKLLIFM